VRRPDDAEILRSTTPENFQLGLSTISRRMAHQIESRCRRYTRETPMKNVVRTAFAIGIVAVANSASAQQSCAVPTPILLSIDEIVSVSEISSRSKEFLLFGTSSRMDPPKPDSKRTTRGAENYVQRRQEIDPRSTLIVRFGDVPNACIPPFTVRLSGSVLSQNSKRTLEIPKYFEAGVEQASPEPRSMLVNRGRIIFRQASKDIRQRLDKAANEVANASDAAPNGQNIGGVTQRLSELRFAREQLLAKKASQVSTLSTARLANDSTVVKSAMDFVKLTDDSLAASEKQIFEASHTVNELRLANEKKVAAATEAAYRSALRTLAEPSMYLRGFKALTSDASKGMIRELAALGDLDPILFRQQLVDIERRMQRLDSLLNVNKLDSATFGAEYGNAAKVLEESAGDIYFALRTDVARFASLQLPDAMIPLTSSSVREGERVILSIEFIADDESVLASAYLSFEALRLGSAVRNVRDVAYFVDRCSNSCFDRSNQSPSALEVAARLRNRLLAIATNDRLAYENLPRSAEIPSEARAVPAPGVVLEALFRPRLIDGSRIYKLNTVVRALGVSGGMSASFLQFTNRKVEIETPGWDDFQKLRPTFPDSAFRLRAATDNPTNLGISAALHLGFFEGAISLAYGYNFGVREAPRFKAIGISFMALTEAGQKLMASLSSNGENR